MHGNGDEGAALRRIAYACDKDDAHHQFFYNVPVLIDGRDRHAIRDSETHEPGARKNFIGHPCLPVPARLFCSKPLTSGP